MEPNFMLFLYVCGRDFFLPIIVKSGYSTVNLEDSVMRVKLVSQFYFGQNQESLFYLFFHLDSCYPQTNILFCIYYLRQYLQLRKC